VDAIEHCGREVGLCQGNMPTNQWSMLLQSCTLLHGLYPTFPISPVSTNLYWLPPTGNGWHQLSPTNTTRHQVSPTSTTWHQLPLVRTSQHHLGTGLAYGKVYKESHLRLIDPFSSGLNYLFHLVTLQGLSACHLKWDPPSPS
jgi:hypothetical protein